MSQGEGLAASAVLTSSPMSGLAAVAATAAVLLVAWLLASRLIRIPDEVLRKLVHLTSGLISCAFPWIFRDAWPVLLLAGITAGGMIALRLVPAWVGWIRRIGFGRALRLESLGDVSFPLAIAALFLVARDRPVLYVAPLLVVTLADAAAAVVGKSLGRRTFTPPLGGIKTVEGSLACFVVAFASCAAVLAAGTGGFTWPLAAIGLGAAAVATALEAIAWSGLDNALVPFGVWAFLLLALP